MNEGQLSGLVVTTAISAFIGAFFSYLFVRMAEILKALYDRQVAGFNALVAIQRWLATTYNINSTNLYVIEDKLREANSKDIRVQFSELCEIEFEMTMLDKLLNVDYINDLGKFASDIQKLNHAVASLNSMHAEFRSALLGKSIDGNTYKVNFEIYLDGLRELKGFVADLESEMVRIAAMTRVLIHKKPVFSRIVHWIVRPATPTKSDVDKELAILGKEMQEHTLANRERITKIRAGKPKAS